MFEDTARDELAFTTEQSMPRREVGPSDLRQEGLLSVCASLYPLRLFPLSEQELIATHNLPAQ